MLKLILLTLFIKLTQCSEIAERNGVEFTEEIEGNAKSSLAFVFDTTGSMYNDLKQLREGAEMILNTALEENGIIGDFVFVPFHDPTVGPATVTRDKLEFKRALDRVEVYGGGDCPEKSLGGIQLALNVSAERSFIYVFTDATAGDHRRVGNVLDALQRKQTQVVFVLTGHCNDLEKPSYKVYQQIAAASSGQVFNLNKASVHKVLDFVRSSIKGRTVNLGSSVNPPGYNYSQDIPVDSSVGEVTVSVSGREPQITVVNPNGERLTGPPQLVTTLDLTEIMVVKVLQPEIGNWSIIVGSSDPHSVKVVGLSNVSFTHGFSVHPARSMADTAYRPLKGTYNHMMITVSGSKKPVNIDYAEILTLSGDTLFELPLKRLKENLYTADAFIPPDDFFYIAINGKDENNQELRRIGTTAVQAKLPDAPYLIAPRKVTAHAHTKVSLKCKVESLVPVTAKWTKNMANLPGDISSLQTTSIEYVIEDMTEADVATYRCEARNVAGTSRVSTELFLLVDPPQISMEPTHAMTLDKGANTTISCTVFSEALLLKFQFISETDDASDVLDVAVEPNMEGVYTYNLTVQDAGEDDAGNYTCVAANRGGSTNKTAQILIRSNPIVQILGPHELSVRQYDIAPLYCSVSNSDAISWSKNGTIAKEIVVNGSLTDLIEVNVTEDSDWMCVAKKGNYEASDSIHISVQIIPQVLIRGSKNVTVINGTTHELICQIIAKPKPRISWYRDREDTFLNHSVTQTEDKTYNSILSLDSSTQNIQGTYFCVGENLLGVREDSATVNVRREMKILRAFNDTSVQLYSQIKLFCNVDSFPIPKITWLHNNTLLISSPNVNISRDNKTVDIKRVDFDNLGVYSCEVVNAFENTVINGSLTVHGLESPLLFKEPGRKVVKEGDSTMFSCRVLKSSPQPNVKWQYRNKTSTNFITLSNSSEFSISNVTAKNSGLYRCEAENIVGTDLYDVELIVQFAPQLKTPNNSLEGQNFLEIKAGSSVNFSCEAEGMPTPMVLWRKDGNPVVYGNHMHLTEVNDLVIDKATEYDSGMFTCNVTNPIGSVQRNFTLIVYVLPDISEPGTALVKEFLEGQLVELPCQAHAVPSPTVIWQHNGYLVNDSRRYIDDFGIRFVANLTDFGDYTCIAINQYGNTSLKYSLFVWVPPYIEAPLEETVTVLKGANTSLQCDVVGFPIPNVSWEFRGEALKENTTDLKFNELGNLYLTKTSLQREGPYICVAENIAGIARKIFYLEIHEPPVILQENYTGPYLATDKDTAFTIACRTTGKPKPYVMWIKDQFYIDKDTRYDIQTDGTLTLKYPTEDMSGNYTCVAKNVVGMANKTVEVMVYSLPTPLQSEQDHPVITVLEYSNTSVQCPTRASKTDTVKWYKDATLVSTGNLRIPRVTRNDQNTYACVVSNAVGSAYSTVHLNIEWPPNFIENYDLIEHINDIKTIKNTGAIKNNDMETKTDSENKKASLNGTGHLNKIENAFAPIETQSDRKAVNDNKINDELYVTTVNIQRNDGKDNIEVKIQVVKGEDAFLDCSVDAKPTANIKWYFNSKPIVFENKEMLKILNSQARNSGSYKCFVGNPHGTIVREFQLEVLEPPFISEFDAMDVLLMEGSEATLECNAWGYPEPFLRWTFNNTNWKQVNSSLTASNITSQSEGVYRCDATNKAGTAHIVYDISVISKAKVIEVVMYNGADGTSVGKSGGFEAAQGSNIRIACNAKGKPKPIIKWLRHGKVLSENRQDVSYADLKLDVVDSSQNGAYSCVATNEGGSDERKIRLEVLEPPKIFQNILDPTNSGNTINLEVLSGQAYYLHCHSTGSPVPEIYWFRDGLQLMFFDDTMVSTDFGEVIQVRRATQEQSGNYTCVARNKVGNTSIVYLVDVLVPPPQPKESSKPVTTRVGKALTLKCPVQGSPVPHVMWHKHPYTEINVNTTRVQILDDGEILVINKTLVSDGGNYSCTMTNKVGTTEVIFDVTIEKPPSIVGSKEVESHVVKLGKNVVLKCEVDGHPLPKITWLKDTQELTSRSNVHRTLGDSFLSIWGVRTRDAGQYICVAESRVGAAHRRYHVAVTVPGKWSQWLEWSYCNVTCGLGYQIRSRSCQYIDENNVIIDKSSQSDKLILDDGACKGPSEEKRKCHMPPCEEASGWSIWSHWSQCSSSCGSGSQARTRRCQHTPCVGDNVQIRKCPGLPKCERSGTKEHNVEFQSEIIDYNNQFTPEAVFEEQPEILESQYPTDVEEFRVDNGLKSPIWYDVEVTQNIDGSDHGPCHPGYAVNAHNGTCQDIDECESPMNQCHSSQVCGNTAGGYRCTCAAGLTSLGAGQRCMDINECSQGVSGCEYACVNVVGGYACACPAHMRLSDDKHTCYLPGLYGKPYHYDEASDYLSASIEYPARYKHDRN